MEICTPMKKLLQYSIQSFVDCLLVDKEAPTAQILSSNQGASGCGQAGMWFLHALSGCASLFIHLAMVGLCCCAWAFSSCCKWGLLFVAVFRLLVAVASLVVERGLYVCGFL